MFQVSYNYIVRLVLYIHRYTRTNLIGSHAVAALAAGRRSRWVVCVAQLLLHARSGAPGGTDRATIGVDLPGTASGATCEDAPQ